MCTFLWNSFNLLNVYNGIIDLPLHIGAHWTFVLRLPSVAWRETSTDTQTHWGCF